MRNKTKEDYRRDWFKVLACESHTWPVNGCEKCWNKIIIVLDADCVADYQAEEKASSRTK